MKTPSRQDAEQANVLLFVVCTIAIVSAIGANVLLNCVTRYNASASQVRAWKESMYAAEAGGDIAYAEIRKKILDPSHAFSGGDWSSALVTFGDNNLKTSSKADTFWVDTNGNPWYRIRSQGTAPVLGLKRVTMDDRMGPTTRGDSLLRKIDFNYDHFIATYGPNGDNQNKALVAVDSPTGQMTRRIELVAAPITPFEAAIKAGGTFYGLGSAAFVDSYRSTTGPYDPNVKNNPGDARFVDARSGTVEINSSVATIMGSIYGNLYTNGGVITKKTTNIYGVIDNNVPFELESFSMPDFSEWNYVPNPTTVVGNTTITPTAVPGTAQKPNYYLLSSFSSSGNLTVNPFVSPNGTIQETYVAVHVTGDIGSANGQGATIIIPNHVHLQVYFDGNFGAKADNIVNQSGFAGNLQFYGISPPKGSNVQQTIDLNSAGGSNVGFAAVFYAPSANVTINGAPDIVGSVVCKNFYSNGNIHWHYDRELDKIGTAVDYRVASYVEDTR